MMFRELLRQTYRAFLLACLLVSGAAVTGCVHRIPIQQGNFLDAEDVARVSVGMTRVQVRALLGTPMIADPFHPERWDYVYYLNTKRFREPRRAHFVVYFDEQDKVARVERLGDSTPVPQDENPEIPEMPEPEEE